MSGSTPALCFEWFPSAFEAICLLQSWSFVSGTVSLKENLQEMFWDHFADSLIHGSSWDARRMGRGSKEGPEELI